MNGLTINNIGAQYVLKFFASFKDKLTFIGKTIDKLYF